MLKRESNRMIRKILAAIFLLVLFSGCGKFSKDTNREITTFNSYMDIPGLTEDEKKTIEALREKTSSFVYGALSSTETFIGENGEIEGFTALFCKWLSRLFGIPFKPAIYEWGDLIDGIRSNEIDFTGEMTATDERRKTFFMTDSIAERSVKTFRLTNSEPILEIIRMRPLRCCFLEGTTTINEVTSRLHGEYEIILVNDYNTAYMALKNGEADACFEENPAEAAFDMYHDLIVEDFLPVIFNSVSLTTNDPDLQSIISVVQKALQNGSLDYLISLYNMGKNEYRRYALLMRLSEEEKAYIQNYPVILLAAEYDNYPISFYNKYEKDWQGIAYDVLNELETLTGLTFKRTNDKNTEWPQLLNSLEQGEVSMITDLIRSDERAGLFIWTKTAIITDNYALISKSDYPSISFNDILHTKIGLIKDSAYTSAFKNWFPDHKNTVLYESSNIALDALERGKVDMVMANISQLLMLTNYYERSGYKANIVFDYVSESTFGFNKNETVLCSIVDKALRFVDTKGISERWMRKTYDYSVKLAHSQRPWLISAAVLFFLVIILLFVLFQRKRIIENRLENIVYKRTTEVQKQHKLVSLVNDIAVLLLESDAGDYADAISKGMEIIGRNVKADRVSIWQNRRKDDGKLYYRLVCQWANKNLPELDKDTDFAYQDNMPNWEVLFNKGEYVNDIVENMTEPERSILMKFSIQSMLTLPIFLKGQFWGYVSFDDYRSKRIFPETELFILRSWGLLAVGAIQRGEIAFEMQNTLNELVVQSSTIAAIFNATPDLIFCKDLNSHFIRCNKTFENYFNVREADIIGKGDVDGLGIPADVAEQYSRHDRKIVSEGIISVTEEYIPSADGTVQLFETSKVPLVQNGQTTGVLVISHNITERKAMEEQALSASRAKSTFLANMSHEIRTPMNAIIGMSTIGKSASDIERKDYCFTKIESASQHLLGVINDILDMSKIEANKFELSPIEFNFEKMLQRVVDVINFRVEEKKQKFTVHIDNAIPTTLIADDQRLAQVVTNLIGNAVKFTPEKGYIRLNTKFLGEENDLCTIEISVSDSGIGISEEQQKNLFKSFQQAEADTARRFGGSGLGLVISRSIIEMMGGKIWINSEPGKGSVFTFTINAKKGSQTKQRLLVESVSRENLRILAIDDDPDILIYFEKIARQLGVSCDTAASGEDALKLVARNGPYNIYFVDWKMPGIDGIDLTRELRTKSADSGHSVAIMISAVEWSVIENKARQAGVDRFLSKPLFPSAIADIIDNCLGVGHEKKEEKPQVDGIFAGRRILLAEDVEINREIVLTLLEPTQLEIDCAENGLEAVRKFSETPDKYDLIFMDVQMPEMDGYEATRQIRAIEAERNSSASFTEGETRSNNKNLRKQIPIIAMTANVFKEDIEKCAAVGMNSHVGKPLNLDEVMLKLNAYLTF